MTIPREVEDYKIFFDPVTTDPKGEISFKRDNTLALANKKSDRKFASYVSGFTDGEGSFSISFSIRSKLRTKLEVRPSFSISQHKRNLNVLKDIQEYFGVGYIRFSKRDNNYKYEVRSIGDLSQAIIPHFKKYPLRTAKLGDFLIFVNILFEMTKGSHLNKMKLKDIVKKAYLMNESGKRKFKRAYLLNLIAR